MQWFSENWPIISFCVVCLVGIGRMLQMFQLVSQTVKELEKRMSEVEKKEHIFCHISDCERYRDDCERRVEEKIGVIEKMIREYDRDRNQQFATISCHLSNIDGYLGRERTK